MCNSWSGRFQVTHPEGRTAQDDLKIRTRRSSSRSVTAIPEPQILAWRWKTDPGSSQIIPKVRIPMEKLFGASRMVLRAVSRVWTFFGSSSPVSPHLDGREGIPSGIPGSLGCAFWDKLGFIRSPAGNLGFPFLHLRSISLKNFGRSPCWAKISQGYSLNPSGQVDTIP